MSYSVNWSWVLFCMVLRQKKYIFLTVEIFFHQRVQIIYEQNVCVKIELLLSVLQCINEEVSCLVVSTNISKYVYIIEIIHIL